jgi:hypothetical protein
MKKSILLLCCVSIYCGVIAKDRYDQYYSDDEQELKSARQEYDRMRAELDRLVACNIDDTSVHDVLRLLAVELQLADTLLHDETGALLDEMLAKKKKLLEAATKVAGYLHTAIMKFATNDILLTGKNGESKLGSTLKSSDKKRYLRRMKKIMIDYRDDLLDKQYESFKRTLGLPSGRYAPYNQQGNQGVKADALQAGTMSSLFRYEPQWCYEDRYGSRPAENLVWDNKEVQTNNQKLGNEQCARLWDDCVAQVNQEDISRLIDDLLTLVHYEIKTHIGSVDERNKMLYGSDELERAVFFDLAQALAQVSPRARALFSTLRDAATENTLKLGYWNPDVYEGYLEKYAARLENAKKDTPVYVTGVLRQDFGTPCEHVQCSIDQVTEQVVYNIIPDNQ